VGGEGRSEKNVLGKEIVHGIEDTVLPSSRVRFEICIKRSSLLKKKGGGGGGRKN